MLPILRIIPVGGVVLAIVILLMALSPPGGSRPQRMMPIIGARGALVDRAEHPEQRQFLMLAALRRAQELERLRDLPDVPTVTDASPAPSAAAIDDDAKADPSPPAAAEPAPEPPVADEPAPQVEQEKIAALPAGTDKAAPDDSIAAAPASEAATIPVEIGEASSTELPVVAVPLPMPRVIEPRRPKAVKHRRHAIHHRYIERRKPPVRTVMQYDPNFNLFAVLFGGFNYDPNRKYGFSNSTGAATGTNVTRQQ